ncbi:hypothetical protein [Dyadobacter arcticus]|uniref:Outer membrane protein beta-barrel domain-containing protein n=1 Tax=Dyadobacter arcticus TaxID=1078754 RepID=A0ABX0UVA1_9BACT|nr:hypothetical protein [Dyadobacter arcticus]NIJ55555.1 hypothetical protein [Dyadobacter arcticus]
MIELPDDELDKLFRKSSEEFDPQFDPEDWNNLKKRLDQQDGRTAGAWLRKWWPLGVLLLLISGGIASYLWLSDPRQVSEVKNQKPVSEITVKGLTAKKTESVTASEKTTVEKADTKIDQKAEVSSGQTVEEEIPLGEIRNEKSKVAPTISVDQNVGTTKQIGNTEKAISQSSSKSDYRTANKNGRTLLPRSQSKAGGVYLEPNRSNTAGGDGALTLNANGNLLGNDPNGTNASELGARQAIGSNGVTIEAEVVDSKKIDFSSELLVNKKLNWQNAIDFPGVTAPIIESKPENAKPEEDSLLNVPKWAIRVGYSPDLTTVGFKNFTKPGSAFSLLLEYGITKRLYVQTGVVRSVKDYTAAAGEYTFKKYVTYVNTPNAVDGICTMIEIPIGIRYDVAQNAHSRWFAGTGFSSYYAQKERYDYHYEKYVRGQVHSWEGKTGWYWLSHLNASVGYERTITKKLSILAEPYIRIPIKGVGWGKVNLVTTGMWISLRYTPVFR